MAVAPGIVLIEGGRVRAAGRPEEIGGVSPEIPKVQRHDLLVMPGLVNAHTHLDLSGPGPWPPAGADFRGWVGRVRELRSKADAASRRQSIERGIELSLAGGTTLVGDIAGAPPDESIDLLSASPLGGVVYIEFFGIGQGEAAASRAMQAACERWPSCERGVSLGLSPHAPYSCGPTVFESAADLKRPVVTHLAETQAEVELLRSGTGDLREMLEIDIGVWGDDVQVPGCHPVDAVIAPLQRAGGAAVHGNWLEERHVADLVHAGISLVYCPRASASFGHAPPTLPIHPWQAMHAAGGLVALGTDSLLCLDTPDRISVLDEMRLLSQRDAIPGDTLLAMATVSGASVLGVDSAKVQIGPEASGLIGCPIGDGFGETPLALLDRVLARQEPPEWVLTPQKVLKQDIPTKF